MRQNLELPPHWDGNLWSYRNLGRTHAMHHHAELEFNLVTRGSGIYLLSGQKFAIHGGDLLWLFPGQEHVLIEQTLDFEMWIGVCKPKAVRQVTSDASARVLRDPDPTGNFCRRLEHETAGHLENLFHEVASHQDQTGLFNAGLRYSLLAAWDAFTHASDVPVRDVHPAVEKAARLIRDGEGELKIAELAQRTGLSTARLSRLFKQQTGVALVDFRNRQRIERFLAIYGDGRRRKLLDAALEAGFGSYPQFHRVFKRVIGCSPVNYRRAQSIHL